jgi:probable rRNA maturation factor
MIKVLIKADSKYPVDRKRLRQTVTEFLTEQGIGHDLSVGIVLAGDRKMKQLNRKYLKRDMTTDVLSFSQMEMSDNDPDLAKAIDMDYLGDVVISWPQAVKQAIERNHTVDDEIDFLATHGLLHLLGIHHD